jgi:dTDP-glucose 4,6-dehydratase
VAWSVTACRLYARCAINPLKGITVATFTPQSILVTGGAGFIGSNFIRRFMERYPECRVVNLDLLTYAGNLENLNDIADRTTYCFVKGDIADGPLVSSLLSEHAVDAVIHFAAESHVDRSISGPELFVRTNVLGTQVLLECCRQYWQSGVAPQFRYYQISTDEVYGSLGDEGYFTEETPLAPNSPYSASKAGADLLVRAYHETYGMPTLMSRCSNNYGPYHFPEKLIPLIISNIIEEKPLPVYGDGRNVRDWLHVRDHADAIIRILTAAEPGAVYNIGGHNEWDNISIVSTICDLMDERLGRGRGSSRMLIRFVADRLGHDRRYAIDAGKLSRDLGWTPEYTFDTGIAETVDWYLSNRDWVGRVTSGAYRDYYRQQYGVQS